MDINFFKKIRILDAGMGQELLARGLVTKGTLWSATSLLEEKYHKLVIDTHLSSICLLYTSPSPRDRQKSRMPSSA